MSNLDLASFHALLEQAIDESTGKGRFSVDRTINFLLTNHSEAVDKIAPQLKVLGLRTLLRYNCRAKSSALDNGPDMFGQYPIGKRIPVPYTDERGKLRWDKKRRNDVEFQDVDNMLSKWTSKPTKDSAEREAWAEIMRRAGPYRHLTKSIAEALRMAERDGK